ncbi:MAG: hypothetical protein GXY01_05585 [Clostridiales bacterium]|jgi:hypothetical protein|nr:hypothetical protein [Clostridiales bacterium]
MKIYDNDEVKKEVGDSSEKITFKTGSTTYTFTQSWIENKALKDILVGLIADDYNK